MCIDERQDSCPGGIVFDVIQETYLNSEEALGVVKNSDNKAPLRAECPVVAGNRDTGKLAGFRPGDRHICTRDRRRLQSVSADRDAGDALFGPNHPNGDGETGNLLFGYATHRGQIDAGDSLLSYDPQASDIYPMY